MTTLTRLVGLVGAVATIGLVALAASPQQKPATAGGTAFTNARLISGDGPRGFAVQDAKIVVRDGKVEAAGPASRVATPAGARVIDLGGQFVVPGLISAHAHVSDVNGLKPRAYTPENTRRQLGVFARYGVTSVWSLGGEQAPAFALRDTQSTSDLDRARIFVAGQVVAATTPDEARQAVARVAATRADVIKIRVDDNLGTTAKMPPAVYRAVIDEAHRLGLRVSAHIFYLDDAKDLLRAGVDMIAHSVRDLDLDAETIALMKARNVPYCPTLTREISAYIYESAPSFFTDPFFLREADADMVAQLQQPARQEAMRASASAQRYKAALVVAMRNLKKAADAGVLIAMGTDSGAFPERFQGYFEHLEMEMMVDAGLTPPQVLRAATIDAARTMNQKDIGAVAVGRWADFVVLEKNPLLDIRNTRSIVSVWIAGNRVALASPAAPRPPLAQSTPPSVMPRQVGGEDWPQWRGPFGTGVTSDAGVPLKWGATDNVAWTAALAGQGVSTPIVVGDRVIVTSQIGSGVRRAGNHPRLTQGGDAAAAGERALAATSADDGKTFFLVEAFAHADGRRLWQHRVEADGTLTPVHDKHNLATPSPTSDGTLIYAWFGTGQLVALGLDGTVAWQRHLGKDFAPFDIQWGHGSSPVVHGELLLLLCDHAPASYLLAVDKRTGRDRWKADRGQGRSSYSTPFVVATPAGAEVVVNSSERVDAYDAATGRPLWHTGGANRFPIPMPVFHDGILYMSRGYRSGPYLAMRPGGRGDVSASHVLWSVETGAPYVSSLVFANGLLFMANDTGVITAADAKTGERVWQHRVPGVFSASPIVAADRVYFVSESGRTIVMRAGRTPEVLAENDISARLVASPAAARGRIFLRGDDKLFATGR